jgi:hypothetical protein
MILSLNKLLSDGANDGANDGVHVNQHYQYLKIITHHTSLIILVIFLFHLNTYEQMTLSTKLLQKLK